MFSQCYSKIPIFPENVDTLLMFIIICLHYLHKLCNKDNYHCINELHYHPVDSFYRRIMRFSHHLTFSCALTYMHLLIDSDAEVQAAVISGSGCYILSRNSSCTWWESLLNCQKNSGGGAGTFQLWLDIEWVFIKS